jgi:TPR repeat protein
MTPQEAPGTFPPGQERDEDFVELAEILSLAAYIDPALIRAARLEVLPELRPEAEAELWFSDLVISNGIDGITLDPDNLPGLRMRLLSRAWLHEALETVKLAHANAPYVVRVEEALTQEAILHQPGSTGRTESQDRIERLWQGVLDAMTASPTAAKNLIRWVAGARDRLPPDALRTPTARKLLALSNIITGGEAIASDSGVDITEVRGQLTTLLGDVNIGVRLLSNAIELSRPPAAGAHTITAPATMPVTLRVSSDNQPPRSVVLPDTKIQPIRADESHGKSAGHVTIETLSGDSYVLRRSRSGLSLDRVVAVMATWADGRTEIGSGYLVSGRLVLTAGHCVQDRMSGKAAARIQVVRASDNATTRGGAATVCSDLDVAVVALENDAPWEAELSGMVFARVDQGRSGTLENCQAIGFPSFLRDSGSPTTSELHGTIYQTDGAQSGELLIRNPVFSPEPLPRIPHPESLPPSPWGGFAGATLFHDGLAIGVVIDHSPGRGGALRATAFDKVVQNAATDTVARQIAGALGLPPEDAMIWAAAETIEPLVGLVEGLSGGDLPLIRDLNPYQAGATESRYGTKENAGAEDPYVGRTYRDVDARVQAALVPGRMVLLVGPSKAGKTRTAFEAVRTSWPQARLLIPVPTSLATLAKHPRLQTSSDTVVVWLKDLQRYLKGITEPLTPTLLTALLARPGNTVVVGTLRAEERARLLSRDDEITREARRVLDEATQIELGPTSDNPAEQAAARYAYPGQDLSVFGLAEQLAGAPALLHKYRDARYEDPLLYSVIQTAIDWDRVGMPDPILEMDLATLARETLTAIQPDIRATSAQVQQKIAEACAPLEGAGRLAALTTVPLSGQTRGFRPFSYLVAAEDNGISGSRSIPVDFWDKALKRASPEAALTMSVVAEQRNNLPAAVHAARRAAAAGGPDAMANLGSLLAFRMDPPDLAGARHWYQRAAKAGHAGAMRSLGNLLANPQTADPHAMVSLGDLLADRMDPPDLVGARHWYQRAAEAGLSNAMVNLGSLLVDRMDPPDVDGARHWYARAAEIGDTEAMVSLGNLLADRYNPPDLDGARHWYAQAAGIGDTEAMVSLGDLLAGRYDPPDLAGALYWYARAAGIGDTEAMVSLGNLLADWYDPPDADGARHWYAQAAEIGDTEAMVSLGNLLANRYNPPDLGGARHWYAQAAEIGDTEAMVSLGNLLADRVDPPELGEARRWYELAAGAGDATAMTNLGVLLADRVDPPELGEARRWYELAAGAGDATAMTNLGVLLADRVDPPELGEARRWYEQAAGAGDATAMTNLGVLLADRVDPPELGEARRWYEQAARAGDATAMTNLGALHARRGEREQAETQM